MALLSWVPVVTPRMAIRLVAGVDEKLTPGMKAAKSPKLCASIRERSPPVTAVTSPGTVCTDSERLFAVTTTSVTILADGKVPASAPGAVVGGWAGGLACWFGDGAPGVMVCARAAPTESAPATPHRSAHLRRGNCNASSPCVMFDALRSRCRISQDSPPSSLALDQSCA